MHAAKIGTSSTSAWNTGFGVDLTGELAPWGFGVDANIFQVGMVNGASHGAESPAVGYERTSMQSFEFSFTFGTAISTSEEPTIAGQPSDVIVGGGANLRVLTAIEVAFSNGQDLAADDVEYCVEGNTTYMWLPQQVTTWVMSVFEIENTMDLSLIHI